MYKRQAKGALKTLAAEEGYETFVVPDDVGGRFSVLTAVGLLPIAVSGVSIDKLMEGAASGRELALNTPYAVSYTHLDVYKRQGDSGQAVSGRPNVCSISQTPVQCILGIDSERDVRQAGHAVTTSGQPRLSHDFLSCSIVSLYKSIRPAHFAMIPQQPSIMPVPPGRRERRSW